MANSIKAGKLLYHLTPLNNLQDILTHGLLPRNSLEGKVYDFMDIADREIIQKRIEFEITDFVPFHFFIHNPFDGKVQKSYPEVEFIYITVTREWAESVGSKILPKHPLAMEELELLDYNDGMNTINWELMEQRQYTNQHCKITCMAECVYKGSISTDFFSSIVCKSQKTKTMVEKLCDKIIGKGNYNFYINAYKHWFVKEND
jgi:hypothetical protein